jgi:hypothetical protein
MSQSNKVCGNCINFVPDRWLSCCGRAVHCPAHCRLIYIHNPQVNANDARAVDCHWFTTCDQAREVSA